VNGNCRRLCLLCFGHLKGLFDLGSKYRQAFSSAVLRLQEDGDLDAMKRKWWKDERKEAQCDVSS
jgi:ABC-type amino acid transport substrate-binding protein